jgi:endonuclease YncB( thermonuclease family)
MGLPVRSPASFLFWLIVVAIAAALTQGVRELGLWVRGGPPAAARHMHPGQTLSGRARIIDGDTIELAGEPVRLFGIDAPERYQECRDSSGRSYSCGRTAARALGAMTAGRIVICTGVDHDRYDREVMLCGVDGRDLSEAMVRAGQAIDFAQYSRGRYIAAERDARAAKRGIWAGTFDLPAGWRRRHAR